MIMAAAFPLEVGAPSLLPVEVPPRVGFGGFPRFTVCTVAPGA